jgi:hypothetical protein
MGLTKLAEVVPVNNDPVVAQITVKGVPLAFRRPSPADFKSEAEAAKELAKLAPDYAGSQAALVHILGASYLPDPEEGAVEPYKLMAEIAEKNALFFMDLVEAFFQGFPALSDWLNSRGEAKNASGGGTEEIAPEFSGSPSSSTATPPASKA